MYNPPNKIVRILTALLLVMSGCGVETDPGPFTIVPDEVMIKGKEAYLDTLAIAGPGERLPNIVLIVADDLGLYDISTYDPLGVPTPALDRLAARGIRFNNAYATSPVCSPSRAGMITGRYQQRYGFERQPMNRYARNRFEYWIVDHLVNTSPMQLVSPLARPARENMVRQGIPPGELLLPEILSKKGYHTGIFGKWHLGHYDGFLPHQRGFSVQ